MCSIARRSTIENPLLNSTSSFLGKRVSLPQPRHCMRDRADPHGQGEGVAQAWAPGLQVGVAQPAKPWVFGQHPVPFLKEAKGHDEGRERMRDRAVSPVEDSQSVAVCVEVCHVEVVVLDGFGHPSPGEVLAQAR